jgi:hypothetical protein
MSDNNNDINNKRISHFEMDQEESKSPSPSIKKVTKKTPPSTKHQAKKPPTAKKPKAKKQKPDKEPANLANSNNYEDNILSIPVWIEPSRFATQVVFKVFREPVNNQLRTYIEQSVVFTKEAEERLRKIQLPSGEYKEFARIHADEPNPVLKHFKASDFINYEHADGYLCNEIKSIHHKDDLSEEEAGE